MLSWELVGSREFSVLSRELGVERPAPGGRSRACGVEHLGVNILIVNEKKHATL